MLKAAENFPLIPGGVVVLFSCRAFTASLDLTRSSNLSVVRDLRDVSMLCDRPDDLISSLSFSTLSYSPDTTVMSIAGGGVACLAGSSGFTSGSAGVGD